jgi:2-keto-4-pentenoate hydratase
MIGPYPDRRSACAGGKAQRMLNTYLMPNASRCEEAARHLLAARHSRQSIAGLALSCRPTSIEEALAIQRRVQELLATAIGGWKCSLPTAERAIACAPIPAPAMARASPCPVIDRGGLVRIEPEIAFVVARDLPYRETPYAEAEVRAAVAETRLVLEILDSRYTDSAAVTFLEQLADQLSNQGLFVGPVLADGLSRPLGECSIAIDSATARLHARTGAHPDGHPLRPLLWLATYLASRAVGGGLKAGDIVTTGSYAGALEVPIATPLRVQFGGLGEIAVEFSAA